MLYLFNCHLCWIVWVLVYSLFALGLIHLPNLYGNFVEDEYKSVFAIALPYTNPFKLVTVRCNFFFQFVYPCYYLFVYAYPYILVIIHSYMLILISLFMLSISINNYIWTWSSMHSVHLYWHFCNSHFQFCVINCAISLHERVV
jgi:Tuberin